jgi:hypothetical protein
MKNKYSGLRLKKNIASWFSNNGLIHTSDEMAERLYLSEQK